MPQDIPVEASETLAFTPPSLAQLEPKPVFMLRAITTRDKRFHTRLYRENGLKIHGRDALRSEILIGLKSLWTEEQFEQHSAVIRELWDAQDQFELQAKDNSDLEWSFDPEVQAAVNNLIERVEDAWAPLRRMVADNGEFGQMLVPVMLATVVKSWTGIDVKRELDRGYLTLDCSENLVLALEALDPQAATELFVAAAGRMRLDKETEGNSASGSPSETTPAASTETTSASDGKSPASEASNETLATA